VPTTETVHPTPVYETIVMGIFTVLLWRWRHRWRPGTLFAVWAVGAGLERFLVEFIRRNSDVVLGLTQPQLIALAMIAGGGAWILLHRGEAPAPAPRAARQRA
jgi:phosphatidylglycerol:prolipoprotein diacylglycerol transferase